MAPGAGERRQAGDGAHRGGAAGTAVEAVVETDGARAGAAVVARQLADRLGGQAGDGGSPVGRPFAHALGQRLEAEGVSGNVIVVEQVFGDQHLHHRQRQRAVGAGHRGEVKVGLGGGLGAPRVDHHEARAAALGLLHVAPAVQVRDHRIATPHDDQPGIDDGLRIHADGAADAGLPARGAGRGTDGAIEQRGAEAVEEAPVHAR